MEIVSYELAKKLKEKGFYYKCVSTYDKDGMLGDNYIQPTSIRAISYDECLCSHNVENDSCIDAPTISQVLKWLREEKLILIGLSPMQEYDGEETVEWCSTVYKADKQGGLSWQEEFYYQSYEQAAIAGIEYVIDNLI